MSTTLVWPAMYAARTLAIAPAPYGCHVPLSARNSTAGVVDGIGADGAAEPPGGGFGGFGDGDDDAHPP